jgi:hypothetical protein
MMIKKLLLSLLLTLVPTGVFADVISQGQGGYYYPPIPDMPPVNQGIVAAGITQIIAGSTTKNTYLWWSGVFTIGPNSGTNATLLSGSGATCATSTINWGTNVPISAAAGGAVAFFGGTSAYSTSPTGATGITLSSVPLIIPASNPATNLCINVGGATINLLSVVVYIQRAG